jgi:hypothetical protein
MTNTIGRFDFETVEADKENLLQFGPTIRLSLKFFGTTSDGIPTISPDLMSEGEIDYYVTQLKADLDAVGKLAKAKLKKSKEKLKIARGLSEK